MIKDAIAKTIRREDLTQAEAEAAMMEIMSGNATQAQIGAYLIALRMKGETVDEVEGLARTMLGFATPVRTPGPVVDVVGTGGDRSGTFNISTVTALVVAGAGVTVAKHGNRAASSNTIVSGNASARGAALVGVGTRTSTTEPTSSCRLGLPPVPSTRTSPDLMSRWMWDRDSDGSRAATNRSSRVPASVAETVRCASPDKAWPVMARGPSGHARRRPPRGLRAKPAPHHDGQRHRDKRHDLGGRQVEQPASLVAAVELHDEAG